MSAMAKKTKAERARTYLFGEVMKQNPAFDPAVVREVLDEAIAWADLSIKDRSRPPTSPAGSKETAGG